MLVASAASLFATTILLSTTSAAPTRTHCRCTVVADTANVISSPSTAHWTPAQPSPSPIFSDICSNLGPELENFQHSEPDLYAAYLSRTEGPSSTNDHQRVFLSPARENGLLARKESSEPRPSSRPRQRIVCRSEPDPATEYQPSFVTLWVLQVIVVISIMACVAEGIHLSLRWYGTPDSAMVPFFGSEKLLIEVLDSEKNTQTMVTTPMLIVQAPNGDRVCVTYDEDEDDEMNRPVM
ncbi:hypothetical protein HBI25_009890 [Parastagonospora nodorum]|nr:hypothetical protein HBI95_099970 [Parastagonospora nodorum]KAH5205769.1 hypothetical protein HBH68_091130 [Parastagonospora nodorum]KAH5575539.1 hypothetical protein HBI25_009890 [Parastagonospora nodorum]KAH5597979.1 hypothetical protein HBI26_096430 [Parastagonospora nodorum]KAH6041796.1 hypothetical protein HBI54_141320 [Parastagonospora nodorum]